MSRGTHDRIVGAGPFGPMLFGSAVSEPLWPELVEPIKAQGATGSRKNALFHRLRRLGPPEPVNEVVEPDSTYGMVSMLTLLAPAA